MFFDPAAFPFTAPLCENWRAILAEYEGVRGHLADWPERELYGEGWKVYGLYDFPRGGALAANIERCPLTAGLVARQVPAHGAAGFSVLAPRTRIRPHRGFQGEFLRCHLALKVPGEGCALKVAGETRRWRAGEALVFDDRVEHEAWNDHDEERVVLLLDFVP